MSRICTILLLAFALRCALSADTAQALTVTAPAPASINIIAAGDDYATQQLGNGWDMSDAVDIEQQRSVNVASQSIAGGLYAGTSTNEDPYVFPLYPGIASSVPMHRGFRYPISTSRYRYLTAKIRAFALSGPEIPPQFALVQVFFYRDHNSFLDMSVGCAAPYYFTPGTTWEIITIDLQAPFTCGPIAMQWTANPWVRGLRFDPVYYANARFEIDWIRLTPATSVPAQRFTVAWSDTIAGTYSINAVDSTGTRYPLATQVQGTSFNADFGRLPAGDYGIEIMRPGASAASAGLVRVNSPAMVDVTSPNERGDQALNLALTRGNPWGPMDPGDIALTTGLTGIRYDNPPGTFYARPTNNDPAVFMQLSGQPIDAGYYRSACFTMQVFGNQDIGQGSVARWYWGNSHPTLTASDDIIVDPGLNEYCFEDLATIPMEGPNQNPWQGSLFMFRLDPHEFPVGSACIASPTPENCRDVRIDSVVLSPFHRADPTLTVQWSHRDDNGGNQTVRILLDANRIAGDSPETILATLQRPSGSHTFTATAAGIVPAGQYYIGVEVDDGLGAVRMYSRGPIIVAQATDLIFANGFQ
jgi:hypothetical protein